MLEDFINPYHCENDNYQTGVEWLANHLTHNPVIFSVFVGFSMSKSLFEFSVLRNCLILNNEI